MINFFKKLFSNDDDGDADRETKEVNASSYMMSAAQHSMHMDAPSLDDPNVLPEIDFEKALFAIEKAGSCALLLTFPPQTICACVASGQHAGKSYLWLIADEAAEGKPALFETVLANKDIVAAMNPAVLQTLGIMADKNLKIGGVSIAHLFTKEDSQDDDFSYTAGTVVEDDVSADDDDDDDNTQAETASSWQKAVPSNRENLRAFTNYQYQHTQPAAAPAVSASSTQAPSTPAPTPPVSARRQLTPAKAEKLKRNKNKMHR